MKVLVAASLAVLMSLTACSAESSSTAEPPQQTPATTEATTATATPTPSEEPEPLPKLGEPVAKRCGMDLPGKVFAIPGPDENSQLAAATLGRGPTVAVFVHQTSASGFCGWAPYAAWAARQGVRALLVDACGWGDSTCSEAVEDDAATWLGFGVDWARRHGAERVTLVGASMGGALVAGGGQQAGADAIVDLSGPDSWSGVPDTVTAAQDITVPFLVAASDGDTGIDVDALREAVEVSPAQQKEYVATPGEHGWDMVGEAELTGTSTPLDLRITALGRKVLAWVRG